MKIAIMQPYFFPYIGYFQLINAVDKFIVYDNVEFTKRGWFHRNKLLFDNKVEYFCINIKSDSDYLNVNDRYISSVYFKKGKIKILRKINQYYKDAPFFNTAFPIVKEILEYNDDNLFNYIFNSIIRVNQHLRLDTEVIVASNIPINHDLKGQSRIFEICQYFKANDYINSIGGSELYSKDDFKNKGINLYFLKCNTPVYKQFNNEFIRHLSIIDVMMFNSPDVIDTMLNEYKLV